MTGCSEAEEFRLENAIIARTAAAKTEHEPPEANEKDKKKNEREEK